MSYLRYLCLLANSGVQHTLCCVFVLFVGGVRVAHLFSFLFCPIMCLYVLSSVLQCLLRFPHTKNDMFVFTSSCLQDGSCLIYVFCVRLHIVVSNTYFVVFLFCFSLSCVPYVARFYIKSHHLRDLTRCVTVHVLLHSVLRLLCGEGRGP